MEGTEELVPLVGVGAKQVSLALVQLDLGHFNGSSHTPLLCNQGSNFSVHVMILLKLSCDSPVLLGPGIVVHGGVCGVIDKAFKEPMGKFPFFIDGDALRGEQLMSIDGFIDADGTQTVQPIQFDIGGKDMDGVVSISDWDEEIEDISFIFFIPIRSLCLSLPVGVPPVGVHLPVLIGRFQASHMCLMFCQILSLLSEYFKLFLAVAADFLIFLCNSCQSLHDEEEFLPSG